MSSPSKSISFRDPSKVTSRTTTVAKEAAHANICAWAWQWWGSLTSEQKARLTASHKGGDEGPEEPLPKKRKTGKGAGS